MSHDITINGADVCGIDVVIADRSPKGCLASVNGLSLSFASLGRMLSPVISGKVFIMLSRAHANDQTTMGGFCRNFVDRRTSNHLDHLYRSCSCLVELDASTHTSRSVHHARPRTCPISLRRFAHYRVQTSEWAETSLATVWKSRDASRRDRRRRLQRAIGQARLGVNRKRSRILEICEKTPVKGNWPEAFLGYLDCMADPRRSLIEGLRHCCIIFRLCVPLGDAQQIVLVTTSHNPHVRGEERN